MAGAAEGFRSKEKVNAAAGADCAAGGAAALDANGESDGIAGAARGGGFSAPEDIQ